MIYLDHNATTQLKPAVIDKVTTLLAETGNASSIHAAGRHARAHIEKARMQLAKLVEAQDPKGVVFTSGASEANNTVIQFFSGKRILTSSVEHPAVREADKNAERIPVLPNGLIDMDAYVRLLNEGPPPVLVSVIMASNETGIIQPIADITAIAKEKGALVHTDAVQAAGRIPINMPTLGVDYLTLSAHKIGGPQGVGVLISAPKAPPVKLLYGGGQERRQRAGTENVPGIAGFGVAAELALQDMENFQKLKSLRDGMEQRLIQSIDGIIVHGIDVARTANTSCFSLKGVQADTQMMALDLAGFAVSSGSACSSGVVQASATMLAMGVSEEEGKATLRVSLGWPTTKEEVDQFVETYVSLAQKWTHQ